MSDCFQIRFADVNYFAFIFVMHHAARTFQFHAVPFDFLERGCEQLAHRRCAAVGFHRHHLQKNGLLGPTHARQLA